MSALISSLPLGPTLNHIFSQEKIRCFCALSGLLFLKPRNSTLESCHALEEGMYFLEKGHLS